MVALVDAFRERNHPVVLVTVGWSPDGGDALKTRVQATMPARARDIFIRKHQWGRDRDQHRR